MLVIRKRPALTPTRSRAGLEEHQPFVPPMAIAVVDQALVITAELPGVEPGDVDVELSATALHLRGEKPWPPAPVEGGFFRSERRHGPFERHVSLPVAVREQEATATFKHGVLTIRAPLAEQTRLPGATRLRVESA